MDAESLKTIPYIILILGVSAMIAGSMGLILGQVEDSVTKCYNASYCYRSDLGQRCVGTDRDDNCSLSVNISSSTGPSNSNQSYAFYTVLQGQTGNATITGQFPTIAIIYVMVIIIGALMSVFTYFKWFGQ